MTTTTGRFDLTSWAEDAYDDADGARLLKVQNTKTFEGGISGTSSTELLQAIAGDGGAAYVGMERVAGEIDGRKGTFVLRHSASMTADGGGDMRVDVVPGSATGDLAGLTGELTITMTPEREHSYSFAYSLP
ncbi:DUF3224 domain-containing protein [Pseudonocardia cypriaca]|uniref:Uncharacterized protein DUF3224 n=1 Tax=Pseudonocardia cypriaca TaxID=882449 RepID=A0A543FYW2_9PSEU|nr:DUF3224 domain-containing protein [Pseudonocardia cypriaca]TQM39026.1 uncharacterized protein DUF3224 [Pseudonocardia cypriaca]